MAPNNALKSNRIRFNLPKFLNQVLRGQNVDLDVKQATMIQKTLRTALPERPDEEDLMDTSMLSHASELDESVKSVHNCDSPIVHKRLSAGKSPRSVVYRNAAA